MIGGVDQLGETFAALKDRPIPHLDAAVYSIFDYKKRNTQHACMHPVRTAGSAAGITMSGKG